MVGSTHHCCVMWCSQGDIPVGLLGKEGQGYTALKIDSLPYIPGGRGRFLTLIPPILSDEPVMDIIAAHGVKG